MRARLASMRTWIETVVSCGEAGNAKAYQTNGWAAGGNGLTWMLGCESGLRLPCPQAPFGVFLELHVYPHRTETVPAQRMIVAVNDRVVADETVWLDGIRAFYVPPAATGGPMTVTIRHPNFERTPGHPPVALALRRLRVLPLTDPVPAETARLSARPAPDAEATESLTGRTLADIMTAFETLAGNCHFGAVQRHYGCEPLGLLRFAGAESVAAIRGLDTDFDGIGVDLSAEARQDHREREWMVKDLGFGLRYHSLTSSLEVSEAEVLRREKTKIAFLRRKFLEDLAEPRKVFVYGDAFGHGRHVATAIFLALRRRGSHTMLWIQYDPDRGGQVQELYPGLLAGHVTGFSGADDGMLRSWLETLANALRLADAASSRRDPAAG